MANSNAIRSALKIMNRVYELRAAGLKLKESKSDLRVVLLELRNELPAEILFNVEKVLSRRSGRDFFSHLSTVIYCAEAALRVAEQMDGYHAEALEMDEDFECRAYTIEHAQEQFKEIDPEVRGEIIAEKHAEALAINAAFDSSFHRRAANWGAMDWMSREIELEKAHTEALALNEETDRRRADAVRRSLLATLEESGTLPALVEACHAEALEENRRFNWLRARFGIFHVSLDAIKQQIVEEAHEEALRLNFTTLRGDQLVEGMQLHRRDGSLGTIKRLRYPTDNTVEILEGGKWREFYRHNTFEVLR